VKPSLNAEELREKLKKGLKEKFSPKYTIKLMWYWVKTKGNSKDRRTHNKGRAAN
jgi:hypothetical protein